MQVFDASSIIHAWDNYPIKQFPPLWDWMAIQVEERRLVMPTVAFEEVANKIPNCGKWLRSHALEQLEPSNSILQEAMRIKKLLGILGDQYHSKGVNENDLLIIATARSYGAELITDEARQPTAPDMPSKRKIPAVCTMKEVTVSCINFIEFIKRSGKVFRD